MDCSEVSSYLDAYFEGQLPIDAVHALEAHAANCLRCQNKLIIERRFREFLVDLHVPGASTQFARKAFGPQKKRHLHTLAWALGGSFIGTLVAIFSVWWILDIKPGQPIDRVAMVVDRVENVHLLFEVSAYIPTSSISISLPPNMELAGYPGRRYLSWTTSLHKGKNQLSLPIIAHSVRPGELIARIRNNRDEQVFRVKLIPSNWDQSDVALTAAG